ncbi:MAG: DUF5802 family protein, partial [Halodesulfurarchaeum sp.]
EPFSSGYYLGRLYVEPTDGEAALLHREQHVEANKEVYATDEGLERLDHPLVMKLDDVHFSVHGDDSVPAGTLGVPGAMLEEVGIDNPPELAPVLVAKAEHAKRLAEMGAV